MTALQLLLRTRAFEKDLRWEGRTDASPHSFQPGPVGAAGVGRGDRINKAARAELQLSGADRPTRVGLRVTDEFGAVRTCANDPIQFRLEGPRN